MATDESEVRKETDRELAFEEACQRFTHTIP